MTKAGKIPYDRKIETKLYEGILKGVSAYKIHDEISHWQNCPRTYSSLLNKYRTIISKAKVDYDEKILGYANKRMEEGSDKLIELALRSKVGWSPINQVKEVDSDDPDEANDSVSVLMEKLGKKPHSDEES